MEKDTLKEKWKNAPEAALIKMLMVGESAAILVFRQPDGTWSAEMQVKPLGGFPNLSSAMEAGEALARQWRRGVV